ncbi:DUF1630-domain-containing protein [Ramaria rubella]|nr:DUF1630-domain-containing protein [Ramaria rubella]
MDNDEVDIGMVRNLEASSWIPPHLELDSTAFPADSPLRGFASPSTPDITKDTFPNPIRRNSTLNRVKTLPQLRQTEPGLPALDIDKIKQIRRWILFDFDLDIGPVLSYLYPPLKLSLECRENIAFSAFPDSSIFETGSEVHSFKLTNLNLEKMISFPAYGYACFMQRRDSTSKRGYLQRSVVILSHHQFPSLFEELVSILALSYLSHGNPMLERACQSISNWPGLSVGSTLELEFLDHIFRIDLPHTDDELQFHGISEAVIPHSHILASVPPSNPPPIAVFSSCLPSLWLIWELLILCEPILIFAPSPRLASLAVWWLRDFVRPIPLAGDFRPYITIHDRDYTSLINKHPPKAGLIIGVTNPFILSVTKHWPNVLSLSGEENNTKPFNGKGKPSRDMPGSGPVPGFVSQTYKRLTSKDRPLLRSWERAVEREDFGHTASHSLRRHFSSRTASFLAPLHRYLNSLIPGPAEANFDPNASPRSKPRLKPFNTTHFLTSLKTHGTPLPFRSSTKQREFYEKWLRTPAFGLWLKGQEEIVAIVLEDNGARYAN